MVELMVRSIVDVVSQGFLFLLWWFLLSCFINFIVEWCLQPVGFAVFPYVKWTRLTCAVLVLLFLVWKVYWC